tara:strand:- start:739 stop:1233 length:495 start_codon:yes stop_codon:yes gene_type:complete
MAENSRTGESYTDKGYHNETDYREGDHDEFVKYLFSDSPKEKGLITLELPLPEGSEKCKNIGLHEFEQLLMIFVDGLKYFYGDNNKVDISQLTKENIEKVNEYFISMNYSANLEVFKTMNDYQFRFPNYFKNQENITTGTVLSDFYYEIFNNDNAAFRVSFNRL